MQRLKTKNQTAWKYLNKLEPSCWVRAYYSHYPKCDNITNNMAEVWNAKIEAYRSKPIINLCEELRSYVMRRMGNHKRVLGTVRGKIAPVQQMKLDQLKIASNAWTPTWTGNVVEDVYEVSKHNERLGVNLTLRTCSCNMWQLTGLPCEHAIAAIAHKNVPVEGYVHQWLTMDALRSTYEHTLKPVNSENFWIASSATKPLPPQVRRPIGRPKKRRRKDETEKEGGSGGSGGSGIKVKKTYAVRCTKCGQNGHYAKTCKGPAGVARSRSAPVNVPIQAMAPEEIPLTQGVPTSQHSSQTQRGTSPPPSTPGTINIAVGNVQARGRSMRFMPTPSNAQVKDKLATRRGRGRGRGK